ATAELTIAASPACSMRRRPPPSSLFPSTTLFRSLDEPMRTQTAQQEQGLVVPMRRNGRARDVDEPVPTVTAGGQHHGLVVPAGGDRKSTRLNSSHVKSSYAVFCLKKKKKRSRGWI